MFKAPFSFKGSIRRLEYGLSFLIYAFAAFTFNVLASENDVMSAMIILILYIPLVWYLWAQGAKRCHDQDRSGWFQLIPLYFLIMIFSEGDAYRNRFGADSKGGKEEDPFEEFMSDQPVVE